MAEGYLTYVGTSNQVFKCADSAALSIAGDIELIAKIQTSTYVPSFQTLLEKRETGNEWEWRLNSSNIQLLWWEPPTPTLRTATATTSLESVAATGVDVFVRVTLDVDNGASNYDCKFYYNTTYTGASKPTSWTQLGSTVNGSAATSIVTTAATSLAMGEAMSGDRAYNGRIYYMEVSDGIGGTLVANPDMRYTTRQGDWSTTPITDDYSNSWARTGSLTYTANTTDDPDIATGGNARDMAEMLTLGTPL